MSVEFRVWGFVFVWHVSQKGRGGGGGAYLSGCPYSKGLYSISRLHWGTFILGKHRRNYKDAACGGGPIMGSAGLIFMNPCVSSLQDEISFCTRKCFAIRQRMPPKMAHDLRTALLGSWHSGDKACGLGGYYVIPSHITLNPKPYTMCTMEWTLQDNPCSQDLCPSRLRSKGSGHLVTYFSGFRLGYVHHDTSQKSQAAATRQTVDVRSSFQMLVCRKDECLDPSCRDCTATCSKATASPNENETNIP